MWREVAGGYAVTTGPGWSFTLVRKPDGQFVALTGCVEDSATAHADLAALFVDAKFAATHREWCRDKRVVSAADLGDG